MKAVERSVRVIVFLLVLLGPCLAFGQEKTGLFHPALGEVIDAEENARYNIFGDIPGFSAAQLADEKGNRVEIFIARNVADGAQMLELKMPAATFAQLRIDLDARIRGASPVNAAPLLPVEESQWTPMASYKIVLKGGSRFYVSLKEARGDTLLLLTQDGLEIPAPLGNIAQARVIGATAEGPFYRIDPNASRLFFAPTARQLGAGSGYFADYWLFFPTAAFGVTNVFSFAGGMSLIPGADTQLLYIMPKLTFELTEHTGLGGGVMFMTVPGEDSFTLGYAVTTFGKPAAGVTLGAGLPISSGGEDFFILLVGGEMQVSNSIKLISENWIINGSEENVTLFSGGVRFFGDRLAVDLALFTATEAWSEGGFPFMPWVDFSVFWGK